MLNGWLDLSIREVMAASIWRTDRTRGSSTLGSDIGRGLPITVDGNVGRSVSTKGASGYSVGLGIKGQSAEVKVDGGFEVLAVAVATCGNADRLDA